MIDRDAPACDGDADLAGGHEHRRDPARPARGELQRHGHLADRAVGADRVHDVGRRAEPGAGRRRGRRGRASDPAARALARGRGDEIGVAAELVVQPRLDVQPERERFEQRARHSGGSFPPAGATPTRSASARRASAACRRPGRACPRPAGRSRPTVRRRAASRRQRRSARPPSESARARPCRSTWQPSANTATRSLTPLQRLHAQPGPSPGTTRAVLEPEPLGGRRR